MSVSGDRRREKELNARLRACLNGEQTHVRVGRSWIEDDDALPGEQIILIGFASELHGTVCTCCPRSTA